MLAPGEKSDPHPKQSWSWDWRYVEGVEEEEVEVEVGTAEAFRDIESMLSTCLGAGGRAGTTGRSLTRKGKGWSGRCGGERWFTSWSDWLVC